MARTTLSPGGVPTSPRSRLRVWLRRLTLALLIAVALLGAGLLLLRVALELPAARAWVTAQVGARVESATGLRLRVEDWRLEPLSGRLEVERLELLRDESTLIRAERLELDFELGPLLRRRLEIRRLRIEEPLVDLRPEWPQIAGDGEEDEGDGLSFLDLARFEVKGGALLAAAPETAAGWVETVRVEGIDAGGSFRAGTLELELPAARVLLDGPMVDGRELTLVGELTVPAAGPAGGRAELRGEGADLVVALMPDGRSAGLPAVDLDLAVDLARFLGQKGAGELVASGQVDLDSRSGNFELRGSGLSGELLAPWVGEEAMERLRLAQSSATLSLDLASRSPGLFHGDARVEWRRGDLRLFDAELAIAEAELETDGWGLRRLEGELEIAAREAPAELLRPFLPAERVGEVAAVLAGSVVDFDAGFILAPEVAMPLAGSARLEWREPDRVLATVAAAIEESGVDGEGRLDLDRLRARIEVSAAGIVAERLQPLLPDTVTETIVVEGSRLALAADLVIAGRGIEPGSGRASLRWERQSEILASATLRSVAGAPVAIELEATLLPAEPGHRRLSGEWLADSWSTLADGRLRAGEAEILLPDLPAAAATLRALAPGLLPDAFEPWLLPATVEVRAGLEGPVDSLEAALEATAMLAAGGSLRLSANGRPLLPQGEASLEVDGVELSELPLSGLPESVAGVLSGRLDGTVSEQAWELGADLDLRALALGETVRLDRVEFRGRAEPESVRIETLRAVAEDTLLVVAGRVQLAIPPAWADLDLELAAPSEGFDRVRLELALADGSATLRSPTFLTRWGAGELEATVPLGTLLELIDLEPDLEERLSAAGTAYGPITIAAAIPRLDSETLAPLLGLDERPERVIADGVHLELTLAGSDLADATGELRADRLRITTSEHTLETAGELHLRLDDRRVVLDRVPVALDDERGQLELAGSAELKSAPGLVPAELLERLALEASGSFELALLNPWLLGGVGSGQATIEVSLSGPPDRLSGRVELDAPDGKVEYLTPYVSRFEAIDLDAELASSGELSLDGEARLNEGALEIVGVYAVGDGLRLDTKLEQVRYRLDYGLSAALSGDLDLYLPAADSSARGLIAGELVVERGLVRRDVDLTRELLNRTLAPADLEAAAEVSNLDLDLLISTRDGVRVRNNIADLRALWSPLSVRGTLAEPRIGGTVELEPGGMLFAYGQTLRVDRGTLTLSPLPGVEPRLELVATTSIEDPSLGREGPSSLDPFAPERRPSTLSGPEPGSALASGLAEYAAGLLTSGVGGPLEDVGITLRPIIIFNESDPEARLVVGRDLTDALALAVSLNLRQAERRTYLLQLHRLPRFPRLQAQAFTNESSNEGGTLQQTLDFGGGRPPAALVERVAISAPESIASRPLRRAISIDEKEPLPDGAVFDTELEVTEHLRRRGYFSPRVEVSIEEGKSAERVRLEVEVDPGPQTEIRFVGERPGSRQRIAIASLYRTDFYEPASREEMREQTVRALRSRGFLEPQVEVTRSDGEGDGVVVVTVGAEGGRRVEITNLDFVGIDDEVEERVAGLFPTLLGRIELAAALPEADARLLLTLRSLGYPEPAIRARRLSENGRRLEVELAPGERQLVGSVRITGVDAEEAARLAELHSLEPGEPVRNERLATAALNLELDLRQRGYSDARVVPRLMPRSGTAEIDVELETSPGPLYRVSGIEVAGARTTRPGWARYLTGVEEGDRVEMSGLSEIRQRLYETGVFSSAAVDYARRPDGGATLRLDLEENPRFTLAYGLRWESEEGGGVVVDLLDRNFTGRGVALGARGLLTERTELGRLYGSIPVARRYTLDTFAEWREEEDEGLLIDTFDASLQLGRTLGRHTTGRVYASYRKQRFREEETDPFFPPIDVTVISPLVGLQYVYNRRAQPLSGRQGVFASVDLSGAHEAIGSDFEYLRLFGQVNLYRPLTTIGERRLGWAQSYRLGLAESFGQILLRDLRFFAGGEYSVRGYPTEGLGPREPLGDFDRARGGEALLVVNQELHLSLWRDISGVAFFDVGNVWARRSDFGPDLATSLGLGVRYASPIGLLRLDLAFPLDREEGDPRTRVYLGFGQVF